MKQICIALFLTAVLCVGCRPTGPARNDSNSAVEGSRQKETPDRATGRSASESLKPPAANSPGRVVHVIVCLCDNENQGIARVSPQLGNGQQPRTNLYWGAMYGVKTFLKRSDKWTLIASPEGDVKGPVLKRALFRRNVGGEPVYLFAEAYDGARMTDALRMFYRAAAGAAKRELLLPGPDGKARRYGLLGGADLICFVGHNGLMDATVQPPEQRARKRPEGAVVLACKSDAYFRRPLDGLGCPLLVSTRGLMAPEAYTLDALVREWADGGDEAAMRLAAAKAYAKYQRCSSAAARRLFGAQ